MWQFEYVVLLEGDKTETFKYDNQAPEREVVWSRADALGKVQSVRKRILVDGKAFREFDFPRDFIPPTIDEAIAYLDRTWKTGSTP